MTYAMDLTITMIPSIEQLRQLRDDLSFVLDVISQQERWDDKDVPKRTRAVDTLQHQLRETDERIARAERRRESLLRTSRWLNVILYGVAVLSVLSLVFRSQLTILPSIAVCVVFVVAIIKANPDAQWKRVLLLSLVPLALVVVSFSVAPLRSSLEDYNTDMAVLGLVYAITFTLFGARSNAG